MSDGKTLTPAERVERVIDANGLFDIGPSLIAKWTRRPDADQYSATELARYLNTRLVHLRLVRRDVRTEYNPEEIVAGLRGEGNRSEVVEALREKDIDPWQLRENIVDPEEMRAYLESYRLKYHPHGTTTETPQGPTDTGARFPASEYEAELALRAGAWRARQVGTQTLEALESAGVIEASNVSVDVEYTFECRDCGATLQPRVYVAEGGCPDCA